MSDEPLYTLPDPINLGDVWRGDTITLPVWEARDYDGAIIDLTGASVWFTAKINHTLGDGDPGTFQHSTATDGVAIVNPVAGTYQVTIDATKTASLTDSTAFFWDVQVRTAGGKTITVAHGTINFMADYTRTVA